MSHVILFIEDFCLLFEEVHTVQNSESTKKYALKSLPPIITQFSGSSYPPRNTSKYTYVYIFNTYIYIFFTFSPPVVELIPYFAFFFINSMSWRTSPISAYKTVSSFSNGCMVFH